MIKKVLFLIFAGCAIIAFAQVGLGQDQKIENDGGKAGTVKVEVTESMATVSAINYETFRGTLTLPDGTTETFIAGTEAWNLDQIKVGDQVILRATQKR